MDKKLMEKLGISELEAEISEDYNPLTAYKKLKKLGFTKREALDRVRDYEFFIYKPIREYYEKVVKPRERGE